MIVKKIPQKALEPLVELCKLLSEASGGQETAASIFKCFLEDMNKHADFFFDRPWPKEYKFDEATSFDDADLGFIAEGEKGQYASRLYAACLKKNINLKDGFSPFGFFWTLWAFDRKPLESRLAVPMRVREDPVVFAETFLGWRPFPYQEKLLCDSSKRIVSCWGRQCGKTSTVAVKAIHFAYCNPNVTVLIASPSLRQSMIMFERVLDFVKSSSILSRVVARKTRTTVQLLNGSQIVALPCSENLLRGYTADIIICDEAAFMPEEVIVQVIFPMLSVTNGSAIFLSTPWGRDHFFYRAFMDPSYSVHHVKSTECPLIKPEFLEEQRLNMSEEAFRSEYLAEFVESAHCFFSQDLIRGCIDPGLEFIPNLEGSIPSGEYYAGTDFGKLDDYSIIAVLRRVSDSLNLVYFYEFPLGTPYSNVIGHLVRANQRFHFQKVFVDQTGVGEPVLEELKAQGIQNVEGLTFTVKTKEELLTCLKLAMEQKRLKMPYHRRLCEQINEQQYEYSKSGHLTFSHPAGSHDDMLWALSLATWALTREAPSKLVKAW